MDQVASSRRRRLARVTKLDWWLLAFGVAALVASVLLIGGYFWWFGSARIWLSVAVAAPLLLPMIATIIAIAAVAKFRPIIDRESILWRWMKGLGVAVGASVTLALAALIGAIVGNVRSLEQLYGAAELLAWVIGIWIGLAWLWWSAVATVDFARLGRAGRSAAVARLLPHAGQQPRRLAGLVADLAEPAAVVICGLVGLLFLGLAVSGLVQLIPAR